MAQYQLEIAVIGKDRASSKFRGLNHILGNLFGVAGGMAASRIFFTIADQITRAAASALNATALFQQMQVGLEGLVARELSNATDGIKTIAEVFPEAQLKAKGLMDEIARISILSPYTVQAVLQVFKMQMAFGFATEQAKQMTNGLLNMAAGIGASNDMLNRMAYNLAQINLQGKVTKLDIRQLALAGLDLNAVLKYVGKQLGVTVDDYLDFNEAIADGRITWEQFATEFERYAEENFAGASDRMARTIVGLKSTLNDVWVLTIPDLFLAGTERINEAFSKLLDIFLSFRETGILKDIGNNIESWVEGWIGPVEKAIDFIASYMDKYKELQKMRPGSLEYEQLTNELGGVKGLLEVVKTAFIMAFGTESIKRVKGITGFFRSVGKGLAFAWDIAVGASKGFASLFSYLEDFWQEQGPQIKDAFSGILGSLLDLEQGASIGDFISNVLSKLGEGIVEHGPQISQVLIDIGTWLRDVAIPKLQEFAKWLQEKVPEAFAATESFWTTHLKPVFEGINTFFTETLPNIKTSFKNFWDEHVNPVFVTIGDAFRENLQPGFDNLKRFWDENGDQILQSLGNLGDVLATIASKDTSEGILGLGQAFEDATAYMVDNGDMIAQKIDGVTEALGRFASWLDSDSGRKFLTFAASGATYALAISAAASAFTWLEGAIAALGAAAAFAATPVGMLVILVGALIAYTITMRKELKDTIMKIIGILLTIPVVWTTKIVEAIATMTGNTELKGAMEHFGAWFAQGIAEGVEGNWSQFTDLLSALYRGVMELTTETFKMRSPSKWFKDVGTNLVTGLDIGFAIRWGAFLVGVQSRFVSLLSVAANILNTSALNSLGKDLVQGLWNGMKSRWPNLLRWWKSAIAELLALMDKLFEIGSPSKALWRRGEWMGEGLQGGLEDSLKSVLATMGAFYRNMVAPPKFAGVPAYAGASNTTIQVSVNVGSISNDLDIQSMAYQVASVIKNEGLR